MGNFGRTQPALAWGVDKIDPISEVRNAGILTTGNVVWVKHPSDADYRTVKDAIGREFLFDDPQAAIDSSKVRGGLNDVIIVCPRDNQSPWVVTGTPAGINLNKDNVHLLGLGAGQSFGSSSVILEQPGTAGTIGTMGILQVTGDGCEVAGFTFLGTAGTSVGGTMGDGGDGGLVTVGAGVQGLDLHDFKIEKTGVQWDAGTSGLLGTPNGNLVIGSAANNITIRDGAIVGTGALAGEANSVKLMFNNTDIRIKNVEMTQWITAAAGRFISAAPGTATAVQLIADRCKFINLSGTAPSSAFGGTMAVGAVAAMNECSAIGTVVQAGTPGSTFITPVYGTATVIRNPYLGIGTAAIIPA